MTEIAENLLIEQQVQETVQIPPTIKEGIIPWGYDVDAFERKPLLSPRGTRQRLDDQHRWYHKQENDMFQGVISGLVKRMQSLPYEIKAPDEYGDYWDMFIRFANFDTWESFLSQLITPYSVFDIGAFVEIIAPGDPMSEPVGAATGMAILDTRRCWPTGDPEYPVVYFDRKNEKHIMHRSRVVQFMDMTEKNEELPGWGKAALSRCISPINNEVLLAQYQRASLDDMPAPGFGIVKNIAEQQLLDATAAMKEKRERDDDIFGRWVLLYALNLEADTGIDVIQFQKEFGGFDPDKISANNARRMANGVGVDIQDFWELSGKGIGTATQSQVLAEKSKGRAFGRLIKGIERMINDIMPDDVEFTFKYRNEEEDLERAQTAQAWAGFIQTASDYLTPDEGRIILTNQVEAVKDATTDDDGNIIRYDDSDPKTPEQVVVDETAPATGQPTEETPDENFETGEEKDFRRTSARFKRTFNLATRMLRDGTINNRAANIMIMGELRSEGREAYLDGVRRTGKRKVQFDDKAQEELSKWLMEQRPLVSRYIQDVQSGKYTDKQLSQKGLLWVNGSLSNMMYKGMEVSPRQMWRWVTNFAKENCITCLRLHGQIHQYKTYSSRKLLPQSRRLVCHGYNCGCKLVKDDGPAKGRIRAVRFVRRDLFISVKQRAN